MGAVRVAHLDAAGSTSQVRGGGGGEEDKGLEARRDEGRGCGRFAWGRPHKQLSEKGGGGGEGEVVGGQLWEPGAGMVNEGKPVGRGEA